MKLYKFNSTTLTYEAVKTRWRLSSIVIIAFLFSVLGFSSGVKVKTVVEKVPIMLQQSDTCTPEAVKEYLIELNVRFPKIVYQQVMVESNWLKGPLVGYQNNLVAMENAVSRPTVGENIGVRFAKYDSWRQSLVDYALWQASYTKGIKTEEQYYDFLDKVYCPSNLPENAGLLYSSRLKQIPWN